MARLFPALLLAIAGISSVWATFTGSGQILVLNSTSFSTASAADSIGCLDETGSVSMDDCATFTRLDVYPYTISSGAGNCSFTDNTQPENTDSAYGADSYAWHCRADYVAQVTDEFYTVDGFSETYMCHGDINCYYDIKTPPTSEVTAPVWEFRWGSQQMGITPGHMQTMWLWSPVA